MVGNHDTLLVFIFDQSILIKTQVNSCLLGHLSDLRVKLFFFIFYSLSIILLTICAI